MKGGLFYITTVFWFRLLHTTATSTITTTPAPTCGSSHLTALSTVQYLQTPGYPIAYRNNQECIWTISAASESTKVKIIVLDSRLENSGSCRYDYAKAFDGSTKVSPLMRRWCGSEEPTLESSGRYLTLQFKTDSSKVYKGFKLKYFAFSDSCGGSLTAYSSGGVITSPGYPTNYQNNLDCVWTITAASPSMKIKIVVMDSILEFNCRYDFVRAFNGSNIHYPVIQTWCGYTKPTLVSSGRYMTLQFKTDSSNVYKGFKLQYNAVNETSSCGGSLVASSLSNVITSPGYPVSYENNLNCVWTISTTYTNIKISVVDSRLEGYSSCKYDYVQVNDGASDTSRQLGKFCGTQTPTYISTGSIVTVTFHTDSINTYKGFKMRYTGGSFSHCEEEDLLVTISTQYLTSPYYPSNYPSNAECTWRLDSGDINYVVSIIVLASSIDYTYGCLHDNMEAFDGFDDTARSLGKWCGTAKPTKQSSGQYMYLRFKTDDSVTDTGFRISYRAVYKTSSYGGRLVASSLSKVITSPGYPVNYENNMSCVWTISTTYTNIKISVVDSRLESSSSCKYDYVQVNDGVSDASKQLGKFCGTQTPTYISTGSIVTVTFHTDSSNVFKGFKLRYTGGSFSHSNIVVSSDYGGIIGGIIGSIVVVAIVVVAIILGVRRRSSGPVRRPFPNIPPSGNVYTVGQTSNRTQSPLATYQPPPPYSQVMGNMGQYRIEGLATQQPVCPSNLCQEPIQSPALSAEFSTPEAWSQTDNSGQCDTTGSAAPTTAH